MHVGTHNAKQYYKAPKRRPLFKTDTPISPRWYNKRRNLQPSPLILAYLGLS